MSKKLNLSEKLDFADIDLTAPDIVINELLDQLQSIAKRNQWFDLRYDSAL